MVKNATLPLLVVFGLDFTLWPFWIGSHVNGPFHEDSKENIVDAYGGGCVLFRDVTQILRRLYEAEVKVAVTSVTHDTNGSLQLLDLLKIRKYIQYTAIGEGMNKIGQFQSIHNESGISYSDMLFFDDLRKHIRDISEELGVISVLVNHGITLENFEAGLAEYRDKKFGSEKKT